ncbi:myostatin a isoform X2 [Esox lucius]|uniref:myostatin a isoform X2 n=1 Tax=Esox lucius TaxID=8010 RepID=UPI0005765D63|nr:myostatin a isoform X2 [Esox lucius]
MMQSVFYLTLLGAFGISMGMNETTTDLAKGVTLVEEEREQCSTCKFRERSKLMRLHNIKSQVLSILQLDNPPNISQEMIRQLLPKAPPLTQLMEMYDHRVDDEERSSTETIITMASYGSLSQDGMPPCCFFNLSPKIQANNILRAQLWVHLRPADMVTTVFLQISRVKVTSGGNTRIRILSLKVDVAAGASSWQSIEISKLLQTWLRQSETHYALEIKAYDSKGEDLAVTSAELGEEGLPFIEVKISPSPPRTRRNSGLDCGEESSETQCCRYPLTVDFEAFGWDWIIAPKSYKANYCSGECEYTHHQKYPYDHLVNKAKAQGTAGHCCTPAKMSPINMLYFNRMEQIVYGKIPSMVVDHCGCS